MQKEQNLFLKQILNELKNNPKSKNISSHQEKTVHENPEKSQLENEFQTKNKSISNLNELLNRIGDIDITEQLKLLEEMDDDFSLKIRSIRNNELHDITVKEWKDFIKAGTYKTFKLVRE